MKKYLLVWSRKTLASLQTMLANRTAAVFFTAGKLARFFLFIGFLLLLAQRTTLVGNYTLSQLMIFFLMFNLLDLFGQFFFRGLYWFRNQVISGEFDFALAKPINPLFQVMTQNTDVLDLPLLLLVLGFLIHQIPSIPSIPWPSVLIVGIAGLITVTAIHILVAGLGVITTEVDHTIMIYRDLSQMARFPIDIYTEGIRALLTFVVPVALAFTFPAKALLGLLSPTTVILSFVASLAVFWLALRFWRYALTQYSSASS